jgi:glycosyltransferase involved in cell wall biosynthesis
VLQGRIETLALTDRVRLLGFRDDVRSIMAAGDVFVLPAKAEPFGLVLVEAMALGKPVIATRAGGPLDIVVPGATGLLVEPGSSAELAEAILALLADAAEREAMGARGRERYEQVFTVDRMAGAMAAVYRQCLAGESVSDAPANMATEVGR